MFEYYHPDFPRKSPNLLYYFYFKELMSIQSSLALCLVLRVNWLCFFADAESPNISYLLFIKEVTSF
jgi:hypothetical protein